MCMRNDIMIKKLDKYMELKRQIDELSYELDEIKVAVQEELDRRGVEELKVGPYKITYKSVTQSRFNTTAFKEKNPGMYEMYLTESSSRRFSVK